MTRREGNRIALSVQLRQLRDLATARPAFGQATPLVDCQTLCAHGRVRSPSSFLPQGSEIRPCPALVFPADHHSWAHLLARTPEISARSCRRLVRTPAFPSSGDGLLS